jgi:hypothetical protein
MDAGCLPKTVIEPMPHLFLERPNGSSSVTFSKKICGHIEALSYCPPRNIKKIQKRR